MTNDNDLFANLCCDDAEAAWLRAYVIEAAKTDHECSAVLRANAHWLAAEEPKQEALATLLGITGFTPVPERWPVAGAIEMDYKTAQRVINMLLG